MIVWIVRRPVVADGISRGRRFDSPYDESDESERLPPDLAAALRPVHSQNTMAAVLGPLSWHGGQGKACAVDCIMEAGCNSFVVGNFT